MPARDLISRAARFFVLAEQISRLGLDELFWEVSNPPGVGTATHLPALTNFVKIVRLFGTGVIERVARHPLPGVLPPEAVRWHNCLVAAWEVHRASSRALFQNPARRALVRLDGCGMPDGQERPSRLPEWLAEAQKIASGEWRVVDGQWEVASGPGDQKKYQTWRTDGRNWVRYLWDAYYELEALAALAAWQPAPGVVTPPETLRAWVDFWLEVGRSDDAMKKGIASIAMLNLPETELRAASIPPVPAVELLRQLTTSIQVAAERTRYDWHDSHYLPLLGLLDWHPVQTIIWPVAEVRKVAQTWLEVTRDKESKNRRAAWRQLIRWDRAGSLALCGMDLLPELVQTIQTKEVGSMLWELSQWSPATEHFTATGTPDSRSQLQQLERAWERYRVSGNSWDREAAWLAGIRLHQAGLASEPPESFLQAYLSRVAKEGDSKVMFILAQWSPDADAPGMWHRDWHAAWQQHLLDEDEAIQQVAAWAFLRQSLETGQGRLGRDTALELWRAGTEASSKAMRTLDAAFSRFQEVRACLVAGEVPDFEKVPAPPAERHRPPLALPPGRIADREWKMENEKLKMENEEWKMKHQEATPNPRLVPDSPSR